jgi:hypothetical protein
VDANPNPLEMAARKYHGAMWLVNSPEHRYWTWEHCPAEVCRDAREALGIPTPAIEFADVCKMREPGAEG